jgi:hypothetical protein
MAKFLWVGENHKNVGGSSSKAYCMRRKGKSVVIKYGPVEVIGGGGGKHYWIGKYPKTITKPFPTIIGAIEFIKITSAEKEEKGYDKLPGRVRIRKSRILL